MKLPEWLSDFEIRVCSAISVVLVILVGVSINLFLYPLAVFYVTSTTSLDCQVSSVNTSNKFPCEFTSCAESCTSDQMPCLEYTATVDNQTLPLVAGIFNCGISVNCTHFENFARPGKLFKCEVFRSRGRQVVSPKTPFNYTTYLVLTSLPLLALIICTLYVSYRQILKRAVPDRQKKKKPKIPPEPKSFYQRKLMELEKLKKEREERERIARYNDSVRVENLNTVTALIFKPAPSWMSMSIDLSCSEPTSSQE